MIRATPGRRPLVASPRIPPTQPSPPSRRPVTITLQPGDHYYLVLQREGRRIVGRNLSPLELAMGAVFLSRTARPTSSAGATQLVLSAADLDPVLSKIGAGVAAGMSALEIGRAVHEQLYGVPHDAGQPYLQGNRGWEVYPGESVATVAMDVARAYAAASGGGWCFADVSSLAKALQTRLFEPGRHLRGGQVVRLQDVDLATVARSLGLPLSR